MVKENSSKLQIIEKMNDDITALKNRQTMPRTWTDLNHNTIYWE